MRSADPQQSITEITSSGCFPGQSRENFRMDGLRAVPPHGGPTSGRLRPLWESVYPKTRLAPLGGSPAEVIALAVEVFPSGKPLFLMRWLSVLRRKAFIPRSASSGWVRVGFCLRPGQDRSRKLTLPRRGSRCCLSRDPPGLRLLPTLLPAFRGSARGPFCRCGGLGLPRESPGAGALFPCSPWSDSARVSLRSSRSESPAVGHRIMTVLRSVRLRSASDSFRETVAGLPRPGGSELESSLRMPFALILAPSRPFHSASGSPESLTQPRLSRWHYVCHRSVSVDLTSADISATGGRQRFAWRVRFR